MTFCSKCGAGNKENANFCMKCGNSLFTSGQNNDLHSTSLNTRQGVQQTINNKKNSIVAVILNFFIFWGLGYWYLGIKKIYGYPWYALLGVQILLWIITTNSESILTLLILGIGNIALAYDVYQKALSKPGFVPVDR